ncbi:rab geranylgeranyl transferase [Capsaspora owczarzaki ATCC 30864]|uniref:Geranylgeranyl transferase type-2 subunit beta n=1 Tax=Capsaspora owczarzaki (strain ATCC 30864) TaxID=595528 RepID=A0A0D2X4R7_CAPO3|nr:rab geranylgeranyl transferase [Capsaspora owczarzaki ATCC 30864]KJE96529.1 rab geranylgeranyl transferase [Capsaspora owczarzaki ATCC 30864]|eukprot:XP_004344459.1 rab geranylgeranyl transferase [Capsaspora owczarzaki ATCC 30864]
MDSAVIEIEKTAAYIASYENKAEVDFEHCVTDHLRVSGIYWGLNALCLMGMPDRLNRAATVAYIRDCQQPNGGFAGALGHDATMLHTYSAIQVLLLEKSLRSTDGTMADTIDIAGVIRYVAGLQQPDGSFACDEWGERDTRATYCAIATLYLLNGLDSIKVDAAVAHLMRCQNWDFGFGSVPDTESHAGQIFCCLATLAILNRLSQLDQRAQQQLSDWLVERQRDSGGLNGRPGKIHDACYAWWTLASLAILDPSGWKSRINLEGACQYLISTQNRSTGGLAPRPNERADVFHTHFAIAGLALLGHASIQAVDARFCLPTLALQQYLSQTP